MDPGRHPIVLLLKFPVEWHRNYVWGPIFDPSYDHFTICKHFGIDSLIYSYIYTAAPKSSVEPLWQRVGGLLAVV